jgi:hypothetical protein
MEPQQNTVRATVVEFHKDSGGRFHPFSLTVIEDHGAYLYRKIYDVEHSRKYGYVFHQSGFGGSGPVKVDCPYFTTGTITIEETPCQLVDGKDRPPWRSRKTKAIRARNRPRQLRALPKAFTVEPGQDILDWLEHHAIEGDAVWCATCRDWFPEDSVCDHVWWCDKSCWWSTPSERCGCKSRAKCRDEG